MDIKEFFKNDRFATENSVELVDVGAGYAKARLLLTPSHLNAGGVCQGGAYFTLVDLALAACMNSHGTLTVTTSANITFLRPACKGYIWAEAREIVDHKKMPYGEVRITDDEGHLLAVFTASGYRKEGVTLPFTPICEN